MGNGMTTVAFLRNRNRNFPVHVIAPAGRNKNPPSPARINPSCLDKAGFSMDTAKPRCHLLPMHLELQKQLVIMSQHPFAQVVVNLQLAG